MPPLLKVLGEVEAVSWKGDEGVGIFASERSRQCIENAFTALAAQGLVRVVTLELNGRCISYRLGLLEQGRLYDYNLAFLPQYADLGSGRVLLEEWIRWGLDEHWRWIDASRVSLENSSHQLHERMTGQLEHWRWSLFLAPQRSAAGAGVAPLASLETDGTAMAGAACGQARSGTDTCRHHCGGRSCLAKS